MNALKKFVTNKTFVTIALGAACLIILYVAYTYRVGKEINKVKIYVAKEDIPARTEITDNLMEEVEVASSMLSKDVIRYYNSIKGNYLNYNTYIPAGSPFYASAIIEWKQMPDSAWSSIPTGNTVFSLPVNTTTTYGNSIFPGDKIDLYYETKDGSGMYVFGKLIEGITILAVKDEDGEHIFKKGSNQKNASALIFSVSEEYHILLRQATYLDGSLVPVPRNKNYNKKTNITSEYLRHLIENKCRIINPDVVDTPDASDENIKVK